MPLMQIWKAAGLLAAVAGLCLGVERPASIANAMVYSESGRFGGWPANHGIWSWGDEILCGFSAAYFQKTTEDRHPYDNTKPEEPRLARSLDGGITWKVEAPPSLLPPEQGGPAATELREPMDFTAPGFAMTLRFTNINSGPSYLFYSTDRGHTWHGAYKFPMLGQKGIAARTDYVVLGKREALVFLTAAKTNGREGRPFVARTTDGGVTWQFLSWIGPEPEGFAIMPSTVRLGPQELLTAVRVKNGDQDWIDTYLSIDAGKTWQYNGRPVPSTGGHSGNPPALVRLTDGRIALTYGHRGVPYGIQARLSADNGKTWGEPIVLREDGAAWDLGYVRSVPRADGKLVAVYYFAAERDKERTIEASVWAPPAPGMRIERVLGPEVNTGPYKHPASIAELANGDLYIAYYGGAGEYAIQTTVWGMRLRKGETQWSAPVPIARDPFRSVGNGVIWQAHDGLVWLFYVVRYGETWSTSRIQAKVSKDNAVTWSDAFPIAEQEGMMVRGRPLALAGGDFLLPVYHETGFDPEVVGADSTSLFLRFDAQKRTWTPSGHIRSRIGNIQPAVDRVGDLLVAYCRRGGGYGPVKDGYIVRAESRDEGKTWSPGKDTAFPNPNAAVDFLTLRNGHQFLVFNDSMEDRTPLVVAISKDNDRTWTTRRVLADGPFDYAYPYAIQSRDGKIHIVYTSHHRTVVNHAILDESWIEAK